MANRLFYSIIGAFLGLTVPFYWLLWRAFSSRKSWWISWLKAEFHKNDGVYIVLSVFAVIIFAFLGYWFGYRNDRLEMDAAAAKSDNNALNELATTDGLTGLFNTRYVHDRLESDLEYAHSYKSPLTCLLLDIDHFKNINDMHGHPFGDSVLVSIAEILRRVVRRLDAVGRLGGEEFIVVMPNTSQEQALQAAERIREAVQSEIFMAEGKRVKVTISVGVVTFPSAGLENKETLLKAVDQALYAAKRSGRNRVVIWEAA